MKLYQVSVAIIKADPDAAGSGGLDRARMIPHFLIQAEDAESAVALVLDMWTTPRSPSRVVGIVIEVEDPFDFASVDG